jgi:hypothetical protein
MYLKILRHMGNKINATSTDNTRPAPLDIHTENVREFKPASLGSLACFHLYDLLANDNEYIESRLTIPKQTGQRESHGRGN